MYTNLSYISNKITNTDNHFKALHFIFKTPIKENLITFQVKYKLSLIFI